jgi:hypothetical protein
MEKLTNRFNTTKGKKRTNPHHEETMFPRDGDCLSDDGEDGLACWQRQPALCRIHKVLLQPSAILSGGASYTYISNTNKEKPRKPFTCISMTSMAVSLHLLASPLLGTA